MTRSQVHIINKHRYCKLKLTVGFNRFDEFGNNLLEQQNRDINSPINPTDEAKHGFLWFKLKTGTKTN